MGNKISNGKPAPAPATVEICVAEVVITNKFKEMILRAHKAQEKVLEIREHSLEGWNKGGKEKEISEFYKIFGTKGDELIGDDDETKQTALLIMQDGIKRIKTIHNQMFRYDKDGVLTCHYINNTACGNFTARVNEFIDKDYHIFIAGKFKDKPLCGVDSQVSTLCHEMSHFCKTGKGGIGGGMSTHDMNAQGKPAFMSADAHLAAAKKMVSQHNQAVFRSAYNVEKYFQIALNEEILIDINKSVEEDMSKDLKIKIDNNPPPPPK